MSAVNHPAVYGDLLDLLAESADTQRVLAFRLSDEKQARLDELLERRADGTRHPSVVLHGVQSPEGQRHWLRRSRNG